MPPKLDALIKVKTPEELKRRLARVADSKHRTLSDVSREVLRRFVEEEEGAADPEGAA